MSKEEKQPGDARLAAAIIEQEHNLPTVSLLDLLKYLPIVQAIVATAGALHNQQVGERVAIPTVRGIQVGGRTESFDGGGLTRTK
jgi:hypothetical protein